MKEKSYFRPLGLEDRARVFFKLERGKVIHFMVQYETFIEGKWFPIVRYDTAHRFVHVDFLSSTGQKKKIKILINDYGDALTFSIHDIDKNWEKYKQNYLEGLKK